MNKTQTFISAIILTIICEYIAFQSVNIQTAGSWGFFAGAFFACGLGIITEKEETIRIKDHGNSDNISFNGVYKSMDIILPSSKNHSFKSKIKVEERRIKICERVSKKILSI